MILKREGQDEYSKECKHATSTMNDGPINSASKDSFRAEYSESIEINHVSSLHCEARQKDCRCCTARVRQSISTIDNLLRQVHMSDTLMTLTPSRLPATIALFMKYRKKDDGALGGVGSQLIIIISQANSQIKRQWGMGESYRSAPYVPVLDCPCRTRVNGRTFLRND